MNIWDKECYRRTGLLGNGRHLGNPPLGPWLLEGAWTGQNGFAVVGQRFCTRTTCGTCSTSLLGPCPEFVTGVSEAGPGNLHFQQTPRNAAGLLPRPPFESGYRGVIPLFTTLWTSAVAFCCQARHFRKCLALIRLSVSPLNRYFDVGLHDFLIR